jgi:arginyl-tRNA--protein-N-Asp/Glu arginylyltransferase
MGTKANIRVYQTIEHACGYWPERVARDLVLDPVDPMLPALYGPALAMGFRRSGSHVYRPHCAACQACTPVRIPVQQFVPSRSQRRCLARNADLQINLRPAERNDETFGLYRAYVGTRHAGGGMDDPSPADFDGFLACPWSPTAFMEIRLDEQLLAVAVTDVLPESLSAVYTFYSPEYAERSLGTFAILSQIEHARRQHLEYLYLGFWLDGHAKMHYKKMFRPLEFLAGREWITFEN